MTKRYEEFLRGTLADAVKWATKEEIRGEFVIVVQGNSAPKAKKADPLLELPLAEQVATLIAQKQLKPNVAIKEVAKLNGLKKQDVYNEYHQL